MTSLTLADVARWDSGAVRDVKTALDDRAGSMDEIRGSLKHLPINSTWSGQAAEAANDSLDKLGAYLANNAAAHHESSKVIGRVASEIEGVQQLLRHVLDFAEGKFSINLDTGAVKPLADDVSASDQEYVTTTLKQVLAAAEVIDRELAHGLNLLDGTDQPGSPPTIPIDQDSERARNQKDAFKRVYGYEPVTANDWRMAAALDPHSYLPKNNGVPPHIVAGRITPQPGKGVVRTNLFIPTDQVINTWKDMTDLQNQRLFPMNFGDNRGPSATADPEDSRVSLYVDYDNGIVVARQNPTAAVDGQRGGAAAGTPSIHVVQAPDGRMTIDYDASDAYENPAGTAMGVTVNGRVTLSPQDDGVVALGGNTTIYPSMETYQYRAGVPPETLQWTPANSGSEYGPGTSLTRHHWVGDATIPAVRPDMPGWKWELENANPFGDDPFLSHTTQLTDPFQGSIPTVGTGR